MGGIGLLDLRLAGLFPDLPAPPLARVLIPAAAAGLMLLAGAGLVMFAADAGSLATSSVFRWKLTLIAIGVGHAFAFHLLWRRRLASWAEDPPILGRVMAVFSVGLWLTVAALGRWIAYA